MDIVSIELGLGLLLLFVGPVIYAVTSQSRKEKQTIKKVEALCGSQNIKITKSAIFQSLFLGIDEQSKHLVTSAVPVKESKIDLFPINDLKSVNFLKVETPKPGQSKAKTIEKVAIELVFKDKQKPNHHIVFFDDEVGLDPYQSANQAMEWVEQIRKEIT
jgi:hypothetical protein